MVSFSEKLMQPLSDVEFWKRACLIAITGIGCSYLAIKNSKWWDTETCKVRFSPSITSLLVGLILIMFILSWTWYIVFIQLEYSQTIDIIFGMILKVMIVWFIAVFHFKEVSKGISIGLFCLIPLIGLVIATWNNRLFMTSYLLMFVSLSVGYMQLVLHNVIDY